MSILSRFLRSESTAIARVPSVMALGSEGVFYDLNSPEALAFLRDGHATRSGKYVTERSAMRNPTFNRAVTVIAQTIGMLPLNLMRRDENGEISKAVDHPAHQLLRPRGRPNSYQNPYEFKTFVQGRALITGDGYAFKVPGVRGTQALIPMDPRRVEVKLSENFELTYHYRSAKGTPRTFKANEIVHLRSPWSSDGITGDGLIDLLAEALGLAEAADEAAARLMKNGSYVGGALRHKKTLTQEAVLRLKQQFEENYSGPDNAGKWLVLEEDMDAKPFGMTGRDAQGIEQRQRQAEEVSRGTGVPRPLLMFDETSWGSGIEQLGLFFVTYCLSGWFTAWEEALAKALLTEEERLTHFFKFNEGALLRGSLKDQADFFKAAIGGPGQGGWMVPDEAREKFDMNKMDHPAGQRPAWEQGGDDGTTE